MRCPKCNAKYTRVKDTRTGRKSNYVWRSRLCEECGNRFTTVEVTREEMVNNVVGYPAEIKLAADELFLLGTTIIDIRKRLIELLQRATREKYKHYVKLLQNEQQNTPNRSASGDTASDAKRV